MPMQQTGHVRQVAHICEWWMWGHGRDLVHGSLIVAVHSFILPGWFLELKSVHVQIPSGSPACCRDMPEPCGHQHDRGLPIGEVADDPVSPADLPVEPFHGVVGPYPDPVLPRERHVGQGFPDPGL